MTLRYASQKKCKTRGGGARWLFLSPSPGQVFPAADKAAVPSHLSSGTELRSQGISEHLPAVCWAGAGPPGVVAAHTASPSTPNKVMHVLFKESGAATPHIQEHHQSLANCLLVVGLSLSCSNFLKKLLQFSKKVAQKLLQNSKSCSKVAPKSKSFSKVAFYFWV